MGRQTISFELEGIEALQKELMKRQDLTPVKNIVRVDGGLLNNTMVRKADFTRGYATGATKRSIALYINDGGLTAVVRPTTQYSPYLEFGTRFMTPQPFVRPAFDEVKNIFVNDLKRLVR